MNDDDFLSAAVDQLSPETVAAASAAAAAQQALSARLTPGQIEQIANALGAPRGPVLALLGWARATAWRSNRHAYCDLLRPTPRENIARPADRETLMAMAVCQTLQ